MRTEAELIKAAKNNYVCWAGLLVNDGTLAMWMKRHESDLIMLQDNGRFARGLCVVFTPNAVYRLRPDYEPEPRWGWVEYEVINHGGIYSIDYKGNKMRLSHAIDRVGFGGVQLGGNEWYWNRISDTNRPPTKARFWEVLA
jgi:hypothetical protein